MSEVITILFILVGTAFSLLSAFGVLRLPDVYTRLHASTKTATLGVLCILVGAFLYFWLAKGTVSIRLLLGIFFVFLTAPVAGHLICRSAYRSEVPFTKTSVQDELKEAIKGATSKD